MASYAIFDNQIHILDHLRDYCKLITCCLKMHFKHKICINVPCKLPTVQPVLLESNSTHCHFYRSTRSPSLVVLSCRDRVHCSAEAGDPSGHGRGTVLSNTISYNLPSSDTLLASGLNCTKHDFRKRGWSGLLYRVFIHNSSRRRQLR